MLKDRLDDSTFQLFFSIVRLLWLRRNHVVHGGEMQTPASILKQAKEQIENFERATMQRTQTSPV